MRVRAFTLLLTVYAATPLCLPAQDEGAGQDGATQEQAAAQPGNGADGRQAAADGGGSAAEERARQEAGEPKVELIQQKLDKYVQTRQLISRERAEWKVQKEYLEETKQMLEMELERLGQRISELQSTRTQTQDAVEELEQEKEKLRSAADFTEGKVIEMEGEIRTLSNYFPATFRNELSLLARLPEDSTETETALGQRMLTVLGIMKRAEEYHNAVHLEGETREVANGENRQVWTLYWGLAGAYYVDAQGEFAGSGYPTGEGWQWSDNAALAGKVDRLVSIQRGEAAEPSFVELPVTIR